MSKEASCRLLPRADAPVSHYARRPAPDDLHGELELLVGQLRLLLLVLDALPLELVVRGLAGGPVIHRRRLVVLVVVLVVLLLLCRAPGALLLVLAGARVRPRLTERLDGGPLPRRRVLVAHSDENRVRLLSVPTD